MVMGLIYLLSQKKKEDISSTSIQSRAKAHEIIRRMLASLGDRYTRFLSPFEVIDLQFVQFSGCFFDFFSSWFA